MPRGGDYNTQGRYYEVLFKAECLKRRLVVLQPEASHLPFDVAVFVNGKFLRIQVKGTSMPQKDRGCEAYAFHVKTSSRQSYASLGVDFIAGYVEPMKAWYIIPAVLIVGQLFKIRPHAVGIAADCKERWDLLA